VSIAALVPVVIVAALVVLIAGLIVSRNRRGPRDG
jgi:hypothetical protein